MNTTAPDQLPETEADETEADTDSGAGPEPTSRSISRRGVLRVIGLGAGAVVVAGAGGLAWRAADQGVFATGTGPAYAAWGELDTPGNDAMSLVRAAVLASNAHNTQPWLFRVQPTSIDLYADTARNMGTMDPLRREMYLSLGCALENLVVAGPPNGWAPTVTLLPDPGRPTHIAHVDLEPTSRTSSPLYDAIARRRTDRAAYDTTRPLGQEVHAALTGLIDSEETGLVWLADDDTKDRFGNLTVRATEAIIADTQQSIDEFSWYRTTWQETQSRKDGITIDPAGQSPLIRVVAKVFGTTREQNGQGWVRSTRDTQVPTAAAYGILVLPDPFDPAQRIRTGRLWQRMHLWATAAGLAVQPMNQVPERIDREGTTGQAPEFTDAMAQLLPDERRMVMAFRIGHPTADPLLSPRRPAAEVLDQ